MTTKISKEGGIHVMDIGADCDEWHHVADGIDMRVLRVCQATGVWAVLYRVKAGTLAARHKHFGSSETYVISGKLLVEGGAEKGGKTLNAGDYLCEPNNLRVHEATYFPEDTLQLYIHKGPIMYLNDDDSCKFILDWSNIKQFAPQLTQKKADEKQAA
jgi:anti-sigma factor ChrR (cupin superfamily)